MQFAERVYRLKLRTRHCHHVTKTKTLKVSLYEVYLIKITVKKEEEKKEEKKKEEEAIENVSTTR